AIFNEPGGEVVEKLGVSWLFALSTEITGSRDERLSKMPCPHAIDDDARGERRGVGEDALGELEAAGAVVEGGISFCEDGDETAGNTRAGVGDVCAGQDAQIARLAGFDVDHGEVG